MNKEISLEQILSDVVMFFDRNKKLIISITLIAVIGVFLFQKPIKVNSSQREATLAQINQEA